MCHPPFLDFPTEMDVRHLSRVARFGSRFSREKEQPQRISAVNAQYPKQIKKYETHRIIKATESIHIRFHRFTSMHTATFIASITSRMTTRGAQAKQFWRSKIWRKCPSRYWNSDFRMTCQSKISDFAVQFKIKKDVSLTIT